MTGSLEVERVSVRFGGDLVLADVSMTVTPRSLHGLIGPNGAGKTTLINAITSIVPLDSGSISFDGQRLGRDLGHVAKVGIARVFQTPTLCSELSAIENVMLAGHMRSQAGLWSSLLATPSARKERLRMRSQAELHLSRVGFQKRLDIDVRELAFGGARQVEIARALMLEPRMILLDEPTAGMTGTEVKQVADVLEDLVGDQDHDVAILLIEHNVPFVFDLCTEITALHQGQVLAAGSPQQVRSDERLIAAYLGDADRKPTARAATRSAVADVDVRDTPPAPAQGRELADAPSQVMVAAGPALCLRDLTAGYGKADVLHDVQLDVRTGDLVAVFGANGAGKTTLFHAVMGLLGRVKGEISALDQTLTGRSTRHVLQAGIAFVPQDPHLLYQQTVADNLSLSASGLRLSKSELRKRTQAVYDLFESLGRLRGAYAAQLSGGERRMLAVGKALVRAPRLLILDEPSIGLAPTTVEAMSAAIAELNRQGLTLLVAEQNVRWLLPIATRKYVLERGSLRELAPTEGGAAAELGLLERYLGAVIATSAEAAAPGLDDITSSEPTRAPQMRAP